MTRKTRGPNKHGGARPGAGRPTLLTPDVHRQIIEKVREGVWLGVAARSLGLNRSQVWEWIRRGQHQPDVEPYAAFARAYAEADAAAQVDKIERLLAMKGRDEFPALKFFLEKRWPKLFGPKAVKAELSGPDGKPIAVKVDLDELVEKLGGDEPDGSRDGDGRGGSGGTGGSAPPDASEG